MVASFPLLFRSAFVEEYPTVIASTSSAPGITGGLGTGMSKYRHPTPTIKLITTPITSFTIYFSKIKKNERLANCVLLLTIRSLCQCHAAPLLAEVTWNRELWESRVSIS